MSLFYGMLFDSVTSAVNSNLMFTTSTQDDLMRVFELVMTGATSSQFVQLAAVPVGDNAINATPIPGTGSTWAVVLLRDTNEIQLVNWGTPAPAVNVVLAGDPIAVAALEDGQHVVVTLEGGTIVLVDLQTLSVVSTAPLGGDLSDVSAYDGRVFVTDRSTDTVTVMDAETFTVIDVVSTNATEPTRVVTDRTGPASTKFVFVISSDTFVSVLDGDEASPTYLQEVMQIVLEGAASAVVVGPEGTDLDTFVGRSETQTLLAVAPGCLTSAPKLASLSPASGIPGSAVTLTGKFSADTKFIVHYDGAPMAYLGPTSMSADLTTATVEVPLGLGANLAFGISATRSSEEAVLVKGNYYRTAPTPFHTTDPVAGAQGVIAGLQGVLSAGGLSLQAKKAINLAIEQINKVNAQLAKGHFAEALSHLANAFAKMQQAIAKGANLGDLPRRLVEMAQLLVFQKLQALTSTLGAGSPLLAAAQAAFDAGRAKLLAGDLAGAMADFVNAGSSYATAIVEARKLSRPQTEQLIAIAMDASFDASERLLFFQEQLNPTGALKKTYQKAIDQLGPKLDGTILGTAVGDFAAPAFGSALGHVKNAVMRMEDLIAGGIGVQAIGVDLIERMIRMLRIAATLTEARVGHFDEAVAVARSKASEAEGLLNSSLKDAVSRVAQGFEVLSPYSAVDFPLPVPAVVPVEVPDVVRGETMTIKYKLSRSPTANGYFRLRITGSPVDAAVTSAVSATGTFETAWDTTNFSGLFVLPGEYTAEFIYAPLFTGATADTASPPDAGFSVTTAAFAVSAPTLPAGTPAPTPGNCATTLSLFVGGWAITIAEPDTVKDDVVGERDYNPDPIDAPPVLCMIRKLNTDSNAPGEEPVLITSKHAVVTFADSDGTMISGCGTGKVGFTDSETISLDVPANGTPKIFEIRGLTKSVAKFDTYIMAIGSQVGNIAKGAVQHLTVVNADIDVDSDNTGSIEVEEGSEDQIELDVELPGKRIGINNDDDDADGKPDFADAWINAGQDIDDLAVLRLRRLPTGLKDGTYHIEIVSSVEDQPPSDEVVKRIRVFDDDGVAVLGATGPAMTELVSQYSIPMSMVNGPDIQWRIEGLAAGDVVLRCFYRSALTATGSGTTLDDDFAGLAVLGVAKLTIFDGQAAKNPVPGDEKVSRGAFTVANLNDTDGDGCVDKDDATVHPKSSKLSAAGAKGNKTVEVEDHCR